MEHSSDTEVNVERISHKNARVGNLIFHNSSCSGVEIILDVGLSASGRIVITTNKGKRFLFKIWDRRVIQAPND